MTGKPFLAAGSESAVQTGMVRVHRQALGISIVADRAIRRDVPPEYGGAGRTTSARVDRRGDRTRAIGDPHGHLGSDLDHVARASSMGPEEQKSKY